MMLRPDDCWRKLSSESTLVERRKKLAQFLGVVACLLQLGCKADSRFVIALISEGKFLLPTDPFANPEPQNRGMTNFM